MLQTAGADPADDFVPILDSGGLPSRQGGAHLTALPPNPLTPSSLPCARWRFSVPARSASCISAIPTSLPTMKAPWCGRPCKAASAMAGPVWCFPGEAHAFTAVNYTYGNTYGWQRDHPLYNSPVEDTGLSLSYIEAQSPNQSAWIEATGSEFRVDYLAQPGGGDAEFLLDGASLGRRRMSANSPRGASGALSGCGPRRSPSI